MDGGRVLKEPGQLPPQRPLERAGSRSENESAAAIHVKEVSMSAIHPQVPAVAAQEKYLIAFVIQGDDVFKITADNIIHTTGTANGPAFDAIAKLKAAAALLELTNRHKERPDELRQMARELAGEGMKLMARASSAIQPMAEAPVAPSATETSTESVPLPISTPAQPAVVAEHAHPQPVALRVERPAASLGPAPVPKPEQHSDEDAELPGNSPTNSKIALISG